MQQAAHDVRGDDDQKDGGCVTDERQPILSPIQKDVVQVLLFRTCEPTNQGEAHELGRDYSNTPAVSSDSASSHL